MQCQLFQHLLTLGREDQQHFPPVLLSSLPSHVAASFQSINQLHRAVMLHMQPVRQFPNPRPQSLRHSFDRQHQFILPFLEPRRLHGAIAESIKFPNLIPEFR